MEEALQAPVGHWVVYLGDMVSGLRPLGEDVDVLAYRQADPSLLSRLCAVPWLSRSCWSDVRAQGQIVGLRQ